MITRIDGDMVHIDAPVFNDLDRNLSQSYVYQLDRAGIVSHVGLEALRVVVPVVRRSRSDAAAPPAGGNARRRAKRGG